MPLFPGYVFCRFDPLKRLPILTIPSVYSIVGIRNAPTPVADQEIAAVEAITLSGCEASPSPYINVGDVVQIKEGPFEGLSGILLKCRGRYRLIVSVTLIQRSVSVEIERDRVRLVAGAVGCKLPILQERSA